LLAAYNQCIAVSIINGRLYIAANEFFKTSKLTKGRTYIIEFMKRLTRLAAGERLTPQELSTYFSEACTMNRLSGNAPSISTQDSKKIVELIMRHSDKFLMYEIKKSFPSKSNEAAYVYSAWFKLWIAFMKVINEICTENSRLQNIFKNSNYEILKDESQKGVHAELQILNKIVECLTAQDDGIIAEEQQEQYVGISKLRCLHCRAFFETANEIFLENQKGLVLCARGEHDLDFERSWQVPDIFSDGYNDLPQSAEKHKVLAWLIGNRSENQIERLMQEEKLQSSMEADDSDSSIGSQDATVVRFIISQRKNCLAKELELFEKRKSLGLTMDAVMRVYEIVIILHDSDLFLQLNTTIDDSDSEDAKGMHIQSLLGMLNDDPKNLLVSKKELLEILKNDDFVGSHLSRYFFAHPQNTDQKTADEFRHVQQANQEDHRFSLEILIPADGDCLFTTIFVGYLLPVVDNDEKFHERLKVLFAGCLLSDINVPILRAHIRNHHIRDFHDVVFKTYISITDHFSVKCA
jgi:hypothetical protein